MLTIQGTVVIGDTSEQDKLLLAMKKDIYDRMPQLFDLEEAQKVFPVAYSESMNTVLIQEMERYNTLLKVIRSSMIMLENAVRGMIVMTPELEVISPEFFFCSKLQLLGKINLMNSSRLLNFFNVIDRIIFGKFIGKKII